MHIKKQDKVKILNGNDRGKEGIVLKVYPDSNRLIMLIFSTITRLESG